MDNRKAMVLQKYKEIVKRLSQHQNSFYQFDEFQKSIYSMQKSLCLRKRRRKLNSLGDLIKELENQSELNVETGQIDPLRKIINNFPQLTGNMKEKLKEKLKEYDNLMNPQPQTPSQPHLHLPRSASQGISIPSTSRPDRHTNGSGSTTTTPNDGLRIQKDDESEKEMSTLLDISIRVSTRTMKVRQKDNESETKMSTFLNRIRQKEFEVRQKEFEEYFKQLPSEESVLERYTCALVGDILLQGLLFVTENYIAFTSNICGYVTRREIPLVSVTSITKEKTAKIIPNAVGVTTVEEETHIFSSLINRNSTFEVMTTAWKKALAKK